MSNTPNIPLAFQDQLIEIQETVKREKVKLTPEVEAYIRQHIYAIQDKLAEGKPIFKKDMEFIELSKMWILAPANIREEYPSIDLMNDQKSESGKRNISLRQWFDVLHIAKSAKKDMEWINKTFNFPGNGKIKTRGDLDLTDCTLLISLPNNLSVGLELNLTGCISLTSLPDNLSVGKDLILSDNLNEQAKQDAKRLKEEGKIKGEIKYV